MTGPVALGDGPPGHDPLPERALRRRDDLADATVPDAAGVLADDPKGRDRPLSEALPLEAAGNEPDPADAVGPEDAGLNVEPPSAADAAGGPGDTA